MSTLGRKLRTYRLTHNLTQSEVAKRLGVSQELIARFETGTEEPSSAMADRIGAEIGGSSSRGDTGHAPRGPYRPR